MPRKLDSLILVVLVLAVVSLAVKAASDRVAPSSIVLAGDDEPGERLRISGTVYGPDGERPVAGAEVHAYHTDAQGYYSGTSTRPDNPRLAATLRTDDAGRYEIRTIRPGAYPGGGPPAHVHFVIRAAGFEEQRHDLHFEGDPRLQEKMIDRSKKLGRFGSVRPLQPADGGGWVVEKDFRLHGGPSAGGEGQDPDPASAAE